MKLAVSNIAWETTQMDEHLTILAELGCHGLELSPSMIWEEPINASLKELLKFKKKVNEFGLEIPSFHSLTYPRPDLKFFESKEKRDELIDYIVKLGQIAHVMECPVMVFGSAKSRQIEKRERNECFRIMSDVFRKIAESIEPLGVALLIEPLSRVETDSVISADQGAELVKMVNHPHFGLHIDLKSSFHERENYQRIWSEYGRIIRHCHVANPGLAPPDKGCNDHFEVAKAIKESVYDKYISIEIGRNFGKTTSVVKQAILFVQNTYL